jgi:PAS domain S-box-containing protein
MSPAGQTAPHATATADAVDGSRAIVAASWVLVAMLACAAAGLVIWPVGATWDSPLLLLALNTVFLGITSVLVAILAGQSYINGQGRSVMLVGCGAMALAVGSIVAGLPPARGGAPDYTATVYNCSALLAAICHLAAAIVGRRSQPPRAATGRLMAVLYPAVLLAVLALAMLARGGAMPEFFRPGQGATPLNKTVLWLAAGAFVAAAALLRRRGADVPSFVRWYSIALAMLAVGLLAVSRQTGFGTPLNWVGRGAQYIGGVYMLLAAVSAARRGRGWLMRLQTAREDALRESEQKLRRLYDSMRDAFAIVGMDGRIHDCNAPFRQMLGYSDEQLRRLTYVDITPEKWHAMEARIVAEEVIPTGSSGIYEKEYRRADGTIFPVELRTDLIRDEAGRPIQMSAVVRDISDRKAAEAALRHSEERYRTLFNSMTEGFSLQEIITDGQGQPVDYRFLEVNPAFERLTGLKRADLIGKRVLQVLPGLEPHWISDYGRVALTGEPAHIEDYSADLGRWYNVFAYRPAPGQFAVVFTDITARKRAEEAMAATHRQTQSIIDNMPALVYALDLDERFIMANAALAKLVNTTPQEMIGRPRRDFMPLEDAQWHEANDRQAIEAGEPLEFEEYSQLHGRNITWLTTKFPLRDAQGRIYALAGMSADISARKQMEEALRRSVAELDLLAASSGELLRSPQPQKAVESICRRLMELLDCQTFFNFLVDKDAGRLHLNACAGIDAAQAAAIEWLDYGVAVCGCAARDACRIVAQHIPDTPDPRTELVASYGIRAYACHPLLGPGGEAIGTLSFGTRTRDTFSDDDLAMMKAVADQVATAMNRMRIEEALRRSEERFRNMFEGHGAAMLLIEPDTGRIADANDAAARFYGYSRGQLGEMSIQQINQLPAEEVAAARGKAANGEADSFIFPHRLADGSTRWVQVYSSPVVIGGRRMLFSVVHDITRRRQAEEALRASEHRLQLAKTAGGVGIHDYDVATGKIIWDDTIRRIWGVGADEPITYDTFIGGVHPADRQRVEQAVWGSLDPSGSRRFESEYRVIGRDGRQRWVLATGQVFFEGDRAVRMVGTGQDITQRKLAEDALLQSRQDLDRAQAVGQLGSWRLDVRRNVLTWSDENHRIFGIPPGTPLTYETFLSTIHPDDRQHVDARWQAALRGEPYDLEHRVVADGQVKWVREKAYLEFDEGGNLLGGFGITQDITRLKTAQNALLAANAELAAANADLKRTTDELARSNRELEQFAYVASHDLQEPLRQVRSFVQLLEDRHAPELRGEAKEFMGFVSEGASRMSALVAGLLEFARVGSRARPHVPVDCRQAFEAAMANLAASVRESGAVVTCDELPRVMAEPTQVMQLFQNLIGNAIKFRRDGVPPVVRVGARRDGQQWVFSIRDNGIGIDPQHHQRVLLIFQRLHGREKYPGTGIGLAICKKITEQHGGRLWIESQDGQGSTFYFTLPAGANGSE